MDRTTEFHKIIQSTHIPQNSLPQPLHSSYNKAFEVDGNIKSLLLDLEKTLSKDRIYESFTIQNKIDKIKNMIIEMRNLIKQTAEFKNDQESLSFEGLNIIITTKASKHIIKLNELIRKRENRSKVTEERRQKFDSAPKEQDQQEVVVMENETATETIRERQKITAQISEIGQIMEEISAHVSLQEESFKRIDDLMGQSDALLADSLNLIRDTWNNVSNVRPGMIKFFIFWIILALFFWIVRR